MNQTALDRPVSGHPVLERLLAQVLRYGTWLASAVIGIGLALALIHGKAGDHPGALSYKIISAGVVMFILLPVFRVLLMFIVFLRERDYRFSMIAAMVLIILVLGFVIGMRVSGGAG